MDQSILFTDYDGLKLPKTDVGPWAIEKYKLVYDYCYLFSTGMKKQWQTRVYLDLFCGPGKAKLKNSRKYVNTSSLLSLSVKDKFDKYIFCDINQDNIGALEKRVNKLQDAINIKFNATFLVGDSNANVQNILNNIPVPSSKNKVLTFCFMDPFSLCLEFETIRKLSKYYMDFLVLLPFGMDVNRNIDYYMKKDNKKVDEFLGKADWREGWIKASQNGQKLIKFMADEFTQQMVNLGYRKEAINNFIPVLYGPKKVLLYYLAFYSRDKRGYDFWEIVKTRNTAPSLFDY